MNVLRLGFEYIASLDVAQVGQPVIEQLRDVSQCSSHLAIRDGATLSTSPASVPPGRVSTSQHWYPSAGALYLAGPHAVDRYFPR